MQGTGSWNSEKDESVKAVMRRALLIDEHDRFFGLEEYLRHLLFDAFAKTNSS